MEPSSGIGQINEATTQMDQVTQQNVGLVEKSAAAAMILNEQATKFAQSVSIFKLARREMQQEFVGLARKPPVPS